MAIGVADRTKNHRRSWTFGSMLTHRRDKATEEGFSPHRRRSRGTWPPWVRWVVFLLVRVLLLLGATETHKSPEKSYMFTISCILVSWSKVYLELYAQNGT